MKAKKVHSLLSRVVDVKPAETLSALFMGLLLFSLMTAIYIVKAVKVSKFLDDNDIQNVAFAYLLTALLIGFFVYLNSRLVQSLNRYFTIGLSLLFFSASLLLFWVFYDKGGRAYSFVFWFWCEIFIAASITQFWVLVNDLYNPRQAKRLVGFFVSGGLLGGITGALLTSILAIRLETRGLLLICPFFLTGCAAFVYLVRRFRPREETTANPDAGEEKKEKVPYLKSFTSLVRNRHLVLLSGIMFMGIIVTTLVDFQFLSVVDRFKPDNSERTAFLGVVFLILLIFSWLLHTLFTARILKNRGMRFTLMISPVVLLVLSLAVIVVPFLSPVPAVLFLYWGVTLKGLDKSLSHSLNQTVRELLYIPVPPDVKYRAKFFIDMFVNKFARGVAALMILLVLHFSPKEFLPIIRNISLAVCACIVIWILFNRLIVIEYIRNVKRHLKIKWRDADRYVSEKVDLDMTKMVFDTLHSRERSSVLYAMNLFDLVKYDRLSPELKQIISQKSDEVQASGMNTLLELDGDPLFQDFDDALQVEEMSAEIDEIMSMDVYQELVQDKIGRMVTGDREAAETDRMEAAKVLGMIKSSAAVIDHLKKLLMDSSVEVNKYAIESSGRHFSRELAPFLINHLGRAVTRHEASPVLVEYGLKILGMLKDYLAAEETDLRIRRSIPNIMADIGTQRAADFLMIELKKRDPRVTSELVEGLYRLRNADPDLHFEEKEVVPVLKHFIHRSYSAVIELHRIMPEDNQGARVEELKNSLTLNLQRIFELLCLIHSSDDIIRAYQNICAGTRESIDYSIELLDNLLNKNLKDLLLPLVDDIPFDERVLLCRRKLDLLQKN